MSISNLQVALLVPEYRTRVAPGGGVATVADFFASSVERFRPDWTIHLISPRMWHRSPESVRLLDPRSWRRGVRVSEATINGRRVRYVGAHWAEIEGNRWRPRTALDLLLEQSDVVVGVAGTPALFNTARRVSAPVIGQVATTASTERCQIRATGNLLRRAIASVNGGMASIQDRGGIRIPDTVLVENLVMEAWSRSHSDCRVELVPPGVDRDVFRPEARVSSEDRRPYILSVGRLADPRKNIPLLIRAYSLAVRELGVQHDLVLAGNHAPPADALVLANRLGIQQRLHVFTALSQRELVRIYQGADLFAMSSAEEGLGLVQLEAISCGIPVVSTRTAGAEFIFRDSEAGLLVDFGPDLVQRLGAAIATVLESPDRRQAAARAALALADRFSAEELGRRFVSIVEETVAASARATKSVN